MAYSRGPDTVTTILAIITIVSISGSEFSPGLTVLPDIHGMTQFICMTAGDTAGMILIGGSGKGMNMHAEGQIENSEHRGLTARWNTE